MSRQLKAWCIALALATGTFGAGAVQACPMCKVAQEDATDPAVAARPKAYMYSILFMLSMPVTIFTVFSVTFYRMTRKQQAINDALFAEFESPLQDRGNDDF